MRDLSRMSESDAENEMNKAFVAGERGILRNE